VGKDDDLFSKADKDKPDIHWRGKIDPDLLNERLIQSARVEDWIAIYGNLLLALTHPHNKGEAVERVRAFIDNLEDMFLRWKVFNKEQIAEMRKGIL